MTTTKNKFRRLAINEITAPEYPIRSDMDEEKFEELVKSIGDHGVLEPILVKRNGDKYEVIAGHRRLLAAQCAELGVVPCIVMSGDKMTVAMTTLHENLKREALNAIDEGRYLRRLFEDAKISVDALAKLLGKSAGYVKERIASTGWNPVIVEGVERGEINFAVGRELSRVRDKRDQERFLGYAKESGATSRTVESWRIDSNHRADRPATTHEELDGGEDKRRMPEFRITCELCGRRAKGEDSKNMMTCGHCYHTMLAGISAPVEKDIKKGSGKEVKSSITAGE
ncbi:Nucleoid occlusion protein [subsurface metagenome]